MSDRNLELKKLPCTIEQLGSRVDRFLEESSVAARQKFELIRTPPAQMAVFDRQNMERVWVISSVVQLKVDVYSQDSPCARHDLQILHTSKCVLN